VCAVALLLVVVSACDSSTLSFVTPSPGLSIATVPPAAPPSATQTGASLASSPAPTRFIACSAEIKPPNMKLPVASF
jgi:hypothetical protein